MNRVRIGLTGLACVFLLVVLAASLFGLVGGEEASRQVATAPGTAAEAPREPLAELGIAPGGPTEPVTNAATPAPRPTN